MTHVTLAPELPGALDLIADLHARGLTVACGRTDTDADAAPPTRPSTAAPGPSHTCPTPDGPSVTGTQASGGAALARRDIVVTVIADGSTSRPTR